MTNEQTTIDDIVKFSLLPEIGIIRIAPSGCISAASAAGSFMVCAF
jgi:hypothetical protein